MHCALHGARREVKDLQQRTLHVRMKLLRKAYMLHGARHKVTNPQQSTGQVRTK